VGALALAPSIVTSPAWTIGPDLAARAGEVERVLDAAFGPGRFAKTGERLREFAALDPTLSRLALIDDRVIGCCRIYRFQIGADVAAFLGPLAVDPAVQGGGVGRDLVRAALEACDAQGLAVILIGQPAFFTPFGFVQIPDATIKAPAPIEPRRFLWRLVGAPLQGPISALRVAN
jgi:predicted N-acetyltransferase YhbS